ncbi:helix-turn-helix domain-containing protein [Nocardia donostiensis]|uniref:AraC family transcriptional regulator n=1 Tax=Nocardia donostiensis TaxID=1538463 RepID=A0A1V2TBM0_9NOCA|nr:helix-turn-helix domain-containing protein [Nocardia donostiensis]ONM46906.1 AraC family transcriptional regulator [Nocardia donostiensis]OQS13255.1 AraC family transcriptional regulator [Nocardia donostiensis]OQS19165.1 AraC family transcriptional regulator [Nocardia donostiensis]
MSSRGDTAPILPASEPVPGDDKGILHPREQARHRTLVRLPAGPEVGVYVEWYWSVRWDLRGRPPYYAQVLPYPCVNVTFEQTSARSGAFVNGVCTTKYVRELADSGETFGVRFRAGGFGAFTGLDVGSFRDRAVPLAEVMPESGDLADRVLAESGDAGRRRVVEEFLSARTVGEDLNYRLVLRIVETMARDGQLTRVDQVTERFGVPTRRLQRLFRRYIGAGPKWVLRRYRLQDGAHLLARGRIEDLAALAAELGYFDQAHFTREFTAEVGMAPLEYAKSSLRSRDEVTSKVVSG